MLVLNTFVCCGTQLRLCATNRDKYIQKGCTRLATASDKVYQLLARGWWFSPGTPASSTTKAARHDIAEILLNVATNVTSQARILPYTFSIDVNRSTN
jgi:hypothetical protein